MAVDFIGEFELTKLEVIGTDCIGSHKSCGMLLKPVYGKLLKPVWDVIEISLWDVIETCLWDVIETCLGCY